MALGATASTAWSTACGTAVSEVADYHAVRGIDLPTQANWLGTTPPYAFDETSSVAGGFDRVGYCLELSSAAGRTWAWVSMEAPTADPADLGLPTREGQVWQRYVDDLTVVSNKTGVPSVTGGAGWLEMWPNKYGIEATRQVPGASETLYDADDTPSRDLGYGSFQVHAFTDQSAARGPQTATGPTAQPVLAVNAFTAPDRPLDVGIGVSSGKHPDWTFLGNAGAYTQRRLTFYARPAAARIDSFPSSRQLVPRPGQTATTVPVGVSGTTIDSSVTAIELRGLRDGQSWSQRATVTPESPNFSFTVSLPVSRASTDLELWSISPSGQRRLARAVDVVAGDVFVINGQSNAVAAQHGDGSSEADRTRWIRTFGTSNWKPGLAVDGWTYAVGDTAQNVGAVGQWGLRMAQLLSNTLDVPVAVVNGGQGGQDIGYFARNDANPSDPTTNYGRLLRRLRAAGLGAADAIDSLLWYQGEADANDATTHIDGFKALVDDWRTDLSPTLRVYVHQVRTSPCGDTNKIALRDLQRRLQDNTSNLRVLSTTDLNGHDGCHFTYSDGYRRLGYHDYMNVKNDLYGATIAGAFAPNPRLVHRDSAHPRQVVIELRSDDPLTVGAGAEADFRVPGANVTKVWYDAARGLVLQLDVAVPADAKAAYVAHLYSGPLITTESGVGLLAFNMQVKADPSA